MMLIFSLSLRESSESSSSLSVGIGFDGVPYILGNDIIHIINDTHKPFQYRGLELDSNSLLQGMYQCLYLQRCLILCQLIKLILNLSVKYTDEAMKAIAESHRSEYKAARNNATSVRSKSHIITKQDIASSGDPIGMLQSKISLIDKLLGNSKEGRDLKDRYFQMILTPQDRFDYQKKWKNRPYLGYLMKPGQFYEDQVRRSPQLVEKAIEVENVLINRKQSNTVIEPTYQLLTQGSGPKIVDNLSAIPEVLQNEQLLLIASKHQAHLDDSHTPQKLVKDLNFAVAPAQNSRMPLLGQVAEESPQFGVISNSGESSIKKSFNLILTTASKGINQTSGDMLQEFGDQK